jgi:site-specific DNA recombinase
MFAWVGRDRLSLGEVVRRLQAQGVSSPRGQARWHRTTVWKLLQNPAYYGVATFGKRRLGEPRSELRHRRKGRNPLPPSCYETSPAERVAIPVPALVDEDMFHAVQEQFAENRQRSREQKSAARYLLQGLLECGCCGFAYGGRPYEVQPVPGGRRYRYAYYRCYHSKLGAGPSACQNKSLRTDALDQAVWQDVQQVLRHPELLRREYERRRESADVTSGAERQLDKELKHAERAISRLIDAYQEGCLEKQEFEPRLAAARERRERLSRAREAHAAQINEQEEVRQGLAGLETFAAQIAEGLDHANWNTRREIIRKLVHSVRIEPEQIRITYRISHPPFASTARIVRFLPFCCSRQGSAYWPINRPGCNR